MIAARVQPAAAVEHAPGVGRPIQGGDGVEKGLHGWRGDGLAARGGLGSFSRPGGTVFRSDYGFCSLSPSVNRSYLAMEAGVGCLGLSCGAAGECRAEPLLPDRLMQSPLYDL